MELLSRFSEWVNMALMYKCIFTKVAKFLYKISNMSDFL